MKVNRRTMGHQKSSHELSVQVTKEGASEKVLLEFGGSINQYGKFYEPRSQDCNRLQNFIMPPLLEKRGHIVLQLSVGRSVGRRSVDQLLSAQYLLTPSLDQYQIKLGAGVALYE